MSLFPDQRLDFPGEMHTAATKLVSWGTYNAFGGFLKPLVELLE